MADLSNPTAAQQLYQGSRFEIVPDDDPQTEDDLDYLPDSDVASSRLSVSSGVRNYPYENGRRYHAYREGEYVIPNDDREQDRLDLHHHIFRLVTGGSLFRAPIDPSSARILDMGTGTGIWAIEMAEEYPDSTVIGTDLSLIQPHWAPPNCYFEVNDFESPWGSLQPFDFIHGRALAGSVRDFSGLLRRVMKNLNPGGWVEFVDFPTEFFSDDNSMQNAPKLVEWCRLHNMASEEFGKEMNVTRHYKQWIVEAGFKNVREDIYKVPLNPWAKDPKLKELGRYQEVNMVESMEAYSLALFTRVLGMQVQEVRDFFLGVRQELVDRSLHLYGKFHFVYGQKEECS